MGLPDLVAPPSGEFGWAEYWFNHFQDHLDIIQAIQKVGIPLQEYIIYPWDPDDKEGILERHQQYHNDFNGVIGTAGSDLSELNEKNPTEVAAWLYLNRMEHQAAHDALGI